jgi:hypothetical protein
MNGVLDCEPAHASGLSTCYQPVGISSHITELAHATAEYAMALDEALEGLIAAQQALQDLQASTALAGAERQCVEQGADTCAAIITSVHAQLVPLSDDLHAQLRQWTVHNASLSSFL